MPKTKELIFNCQNVEVTPNNAYVVVVTAHEPNIETILSEIHTDDLIEYVQKNIGPEEIFSQSELDKWAESEGYIKQENQ